MPVMMNCLAMMNFSAKVRILPENAKTFHHFFAQVATKKYIGEGGGCGGCVLSRRSEGVARA